MGVKNVLKSNVNSLDDYKSSSLKAEYQKKLLKKKQKIFNKLKEIKNG